MRSSLVTAFLCLLFICAHSANATASNCSICHSAMKGQIKTEKGLLIDLYVDADKYAQSVHSKFDCATCHKGFGPNPHEAPKGVDIPKDIAAMASKISHKAKSDPIALASCMQCHSDAYKAWEKSIHGENVIGKKQIDGALCIDCHGSPHYITPKNLATSSVYKMNIVKTCGECHEKEDIVKKYNLGTHILVRYNESFHGKKYILGHKNAPSCSDCHSSHDVKKWDDPLSPVAWENRTKTCGKCHEGATPKFVASITHKPIGKDNPVPYYFGKLLTILLVSVFAFITGHIILEIFSEIRDRVFRKGGHHE